MDPEYSRCVQKVFVELYKKGLIYRGKRMVNWCPVSQTALSDEEVEMKPQKGFMYHFKVEVADTRSAGFQPASSSATTEPAAKMAALPGADGKIWLTIATTRPETIPGDTAVAVNPKDPRYAHLIGKHIVRPLPAELPRERKLIPIIGDEHVDFEFGTGVLKVTPAHDKADFDIGTRHKLPLIEVINADGSMNDLAGADLRGLDRFKARKIAVEKLRELKVLVEEKPYENNVGFSQRADVPIEPRLSEQWFLKYPAVEQSKACVEQDSDSEGRVTRVPNSGSQGLVELVPPTGKMRFHPQRWAKVYDHWLTNIQDWCISRQLWWGHRIPVWTLTWKNQSDAMEEIWNNKVYGHFKEWIKEAGLEREVFFHENLIPPFPVQILTFTPNADARLGELADLHRKGNSSANSEFGKRCPHGFSLLQVMISLEQDPDVLDTWFSSWLWPFATMGWPEQTETLKKFYPTTDLVTGPDIIFFWVARMIMAGYEFMGDLPFQNVYFTGIIRDKQGRKMSKTLGNSPDPLVLIAQYGADALRFGTMRSAPLGQDVLFDEKDVELGRNFCNKLWNACRFRQMQGGEVQSEINPSLLTSDDKWILLKLNDAIREVSIALNEYKFSEATAALYRFFWSEYCDWYVEASKAAFFSSSRREAAQTSEPGAESQSGLTSAATDPKVVNTLAVIDFVLSHTLRLFHPFLPFITEELWHGMGYATDMPDNQGGKTIMNAPWPLPFDDDMKGHYSLGDCYVEMANAKYELVTFGRNLRREFNIQAGKKVKFILKPAQPLTTHDAEVIKLLLNAESLEVNADYQPPKGTPTVASKLGELFLPLEGLIDVEAEKVRLTKKVEEYQAEIAKVEQKLANPSFTRKVPPQVLAEHQQRLVEWRAKEAQVQLALQNLLQ